eukprot:superscaffoldBa00002690_g15008
MVSVASAWSMYPYYRYYGGSVTFTPKGQNSDGTYEVEFRNKQTSYYCYQNGYTCYYGNCGSQTQTTNALIARNSYGLAWCQYEVVTNRKLSSNQPFAIRYPTSYNSHYGQGYWYSNVRSSQAAWRMMAHVDLGTRSDTGESNRSPITTMLPVLRVPRNCPRSFNMTVFDPDGDRVRCRVPTRSSTYECGLCGLVSGFSLDQNSCSLQYTRSTRIGFHPIELVVEDFPNKYITLSYSNVDSYQARSCLDGDYFPIFLSPTPSNGVNLPAFVNQTLEIKVVSTAQYSTIYDLIIAGPEGISKQKISTEEFVIKWTPTDNELNDHFPICFVSEARDKVYRHQIYQSELRCVIVDVGHHETTVTCNETTITVEVEKSYLIRRNEDNLHLNDFTDPSCNLTTSSNSTHLVAVMSLNTCGTLIEEDEDNIIFKNEITSADPNQIISRQHDVEIAFSCVYPKRTNVTLGFSHKNPYAFTEKGFGAFTFQFEFFDSQLFRTQKDASTYPVEVYLKQMIFMQIEATTSIPNTELFVYITCSVILCETGISGTRCSQGCIRSDSGSHRSKREAVAQTSSHSISQGPLRLVRTSDSQVSGSSMNLGLNIIFIVGCLLVCVVVVYRSRRSKAKYQPLPTSEMD